MLCFWSLLRGCLSVSRCARSLVPSRPGTGVQSSLLVSHRYHIISLDFLRFEQECVFVLRDGVRERDRYHHMSNAKQTRRVTPASRDTLLHMLETLPDAFFVVDDAA